MTKPGERKTSYAYDGNYNVVGITDPKGHLYEYSYDKDDRLIGTELETGQFFKSTEVITVFE